MTFNDNKFTQSIYNLRKGTAKINIHTLLEVSCLQVDRIDSGNNFNCKISSISHPLSTGRDITVKANPKSRRRRYLPWLFEIHNLQDIHEGRMDHPQEPAVLLRSSIGILE